MDANRPFLTEDGVLIIPADCADEYRWWVEGGRSVAEILKELNACRSVWSRYSSDPYPDELQKEVYPLLGGE